MTTPLFDPPPTYALVVSWHGDLSVDFQYFDPDDAALDPPVWTPLDYPDGVEAYLDIRIKKASGAVAEEFVRTPAVIDGHHAYVKVESEDTDLLKGGQIWVYLISYPEDPTHEVPTMNGVIERHDGDS